MGTIKTFRDLIAWQKGMELARGVYRDTTAMPADERFGLTMQMRRAAVSIPSNIADGYARQSKPDYVRFLRTARGSLAELRTQMELAESLTLLTPSAQTRNLLDKADRVLQGLIRSLK